MSEKQCVTCHQVKPLDDFHRNRKAADGRQSNCKRCVGEYDRRWRQANPERRREAGRRWSVANREQIRERKRRYREANVEQARNWNRRYREANPERARESKNRWRAHVQALVFNHYGWVCACCGSTKSLTIDHIAGDGKQHRIELFGRNGVSEQFYLWLIENGYPDGYQTLCLRCNMSKGTGPACRLNHDEEAGR